MLISFSNNLGVVLLSNAGHGGMGQIGNAVFEYAEETNFIPTGDINYDGLINNEDINILFNLILIEDYNFISDLNLDNKMNILDLLGLIEIAIF